MYASRVPEATGPDVLQLLLDARADVSERDSSARTALMVAAERANLRSATILLDAGADVNAVASSGGKASSKVMGLRGQVVDTFFHGHTGNIVETFSSLQRAKEKAKRAQEIANFEAQFMLDSEDQEEVSMSFAAIPTIEVSLAVSAIADADLEPSSSEEDSGYFDGGQEDFIDGVFQSRVAPLRKRDLPEEPLPPEEAQRQRDSAYFLRRCPPRGVGGGETALLLAARRGHADLCQLFLRRGATDGDAALLEAARAGHAEACRVLSYGRPRSVPPVSPATQAAAVEEARRYGKEVAVSALLGYQSYVLKA